ncbi:MAG: hypothetical protein KatS3mg043_1153 [Rhodothermaceae bacterium]|nr:MAG: hypothetical protein KatS3mg043_1153 [Rhodothermaceae bacterium]
MLLLTGDNALRKLAQSLGIEVHGVLWVLDQLYDDGFSPRRLEKGLKQILSAGAYLPQEEVIRRFNTWL